MQPEWIWLSEAPAGESYALLRKTFVLNIAPNQATLEVTANQRYRVFLNGVELGQGPVPGHPGRMFFDSYEVAEHLHGGLNVVAVLAHNYGDAETALKQATGPAGAWCRLVVDKAVILATDASWSALAAPDYETRNDVIVGHRGGFKEYYHPERALCGWQEVDFDASDWPAASVLPLDALVQPQSAEIPPKRHWPAWPVEVYLESGAFAYGGPYEADNLDALTRDGTGCAEVKPSSDFAPALLLDFGQDAVGTFELEFEEATGGLLEISYGESLHTTAVDYVRLQPGPLAYRPLYRRVARYVRLRFHNLQGPVHIRRARFMCESYGKETCGGFTCSDEVLNRIWQVGVHTLDCCMQDHFEDCPWREQALYPGDLRVSALLAYYAKGDYALARKCLRQLAETQHPSGAIPTVGPAPSPLRVIPEYPAHWVGALYDYWWYSGDATLVQELFPPLERCMHWYESELDAAGLMSDMDDTAKWFFFVDNLCGLEARGAVTAVQAFVVQSFALASELAEVADEPGSAAEWREQAGSLRQSLQQLWDGEQAAFKDNSQQQAAPEVANEISCGVPVYCGLVDDAQRRACVEILEGARGARRTQAGFSNFFLTEALYRAGNGAAATGRIRDYWGAMLADGATTFWEVFDPEWPKGKLPHRLWSMCHEFCAGPVYSLPAHVLGVRPSAPGFAEITLEPEISQLAWAQGTIPTPHGPVEIAWHKVEHKLYLEVRHPGTVKIKGLKAPAGYSVEPTFSSY